MKITIVRLVIFFSLSFPAFGNDCKVWEPASVERRIVGVQPDDWNWSCDSIGALNGSVFNRKYEATKIIITGVPSDRSVGKKVFGFEPNTSYDFYFLSGNGICGVDKSAKLELEYMIEKPSFCKQRFSDAEMAARRKNEAEVRRQNAAKAEIQARENILYDNCVIAKSKGIDRAAIASVRSVCRNIARNPNTWQKFKWGP